MADQDPWALYGETRDRLIALLRPLTPQQVEQTVPMTPGWTIADVLAHVCGLNADIASGLREGLGTDERTAEQVRTRSRMTVEAICDEWLGHAEGMRAAIADDAFFGRRPTADLVVHLHDLQHALGEPIDRNDEATSSGGQTYASRTPDRLVEVAAVHLVIEFGDETRFEPSSGATADMPSLLLRSNPYDFLRSVTGRRSRAEVAALDWSADPSPLLDQFSPYGPLRAMPAGV